MGGPESSGSQAATYVYGVTPSTATVPHVRGIGDGDGSVRIVRWGELGALASHVDRREVDSARALRAHARVLDAVIQTGSVVPLRFGTMVDDDPAVVTQVLQRHQHRFVELLERLGQHLELAVRVSYDEDAVLRQLMASDPAIASRHERIAGVDPDAAYYERITLGEQVAAALERRRDRDAEEIYGTLCAVADDVSVGTPVRPQVVVDGTFLVRRSDVDLFYDAIGASTRAHPEVRAHVIGPLPPYSFSDVEPVS